MSTWYADVDFALTGEVSDNAEFDALEAMRDWSAVISISRDRRAGTLSLAIDSADAQEAMSSLSVILQPARSVLGDFQITKMDIMDAEKRRSQVEEITFPELVGYAEIADMAAVTRQRARQIASRADFPVPVVETASGPLRVKAAVEKWLSSWDRVPGRPRGVSSIG